MKKPLILNFLPVATGGGLQNSLSFLKTLPLDRYHFTVLCRKGSPIETACKDRSIPYLSVPSRIRFELHDARESFPRGSICFTIFGPPVFRSSGYWLNICGVAYSNLFYPELDFWGHLKFPKKQLKHLKDLARRRLTTLGDAWIFETKLLATRAVERGFPEERVFHVPMAISRAVLEKGETTEDQINSSKDRRILYLGAAHPNKRQHLLPSIAKSLEEAGDNNFVFVTTMDESLSYAKQVLLEFARQGVAHRIDNIGPVHPSAVGEVVSQADAMILLSALESFSNNLVESWALKRPLIVTDALWSRDSCGEGAMYLDPTNPLESADRIRNLFFDKRQQSKIIENGAAALGRYPTPERKTELYLEVIQQVAEMGPCPRSQKSNISF